MSDVVAGPAECTAAGSVGSRKEEGINACEKCSDRWLVGNEAHWCRVAAIMVVLAFALMLNRTGSLWVLSMSADWYCDLFLLE